METRSPQWLPVWWKPAYNWRPLDTMTAASIWGGFDVGASLNRTSRHRPSTTCGSLFLWFWRQGLFFFSPPSSCGFCCYLWCQAQTLGRLMRAALKRAILCSSDSVLTALGLKQSCWTEPWSVSSVGAIYLTWLTLNICTVVCFGQVVSPLKHTRSISSV